MSVQRSAAKRAVRSIGIVAVCVAAALGVAYLWSPLTISTTYQSTARILLFAVSSDTFATTDDAGSSEERTQEQRDALQRLTSDEVQAEAESRLGFSAAISARFDALFDILFVQAFDSDPGRAQQIAQTYAEVYVTVGEDEVLAERQAAVDKVKERIDEIDAQVEAIGPDGETSRLLNLRNDLAESYDLLLITAQLGVLPGDRIIDDARLPSKPFSVEPNTKGNLLAGGLAGLVIGVCAAVLDRLLWNKAED